MKILLVVFGEKNLICDNLIFSGHFLMFDLGVVKTGQGHCYYCIYKKSGHD